MAGPWSGSQYTNNSDMTPEDPRSQKMWRVGDAGQLGPTKDRRGLDWQIRGKGTL